MHPVFGLFTRDGDSDGVHNDGAMSSDVENQRSPGIDERNADEAAYSEETGKFSWMNWSSSLGYFTGREVNFRGLNDEHEIQQSNSDESEGANSDTSGTESETSDSSSSEPRGRSRYRKQRSTRRHTSLPTKSSIEGMAKKYDERSSKRTRVEPEEHFDFCSHGKSWTLCGILFAWTGMALSFIARNSTQFVELETPIYVDANFNEVKTIGMVNLELCYNETFTEISGCHNERLESEDISDTMFEVSRSMASLAYLFGGFMAVFMTAAIYWQSINLRPVGFGFLVAYFMQSFTFLFFDSSMCATYKCHVARGTIQSIVASFFWLFACICAAKMDSHKYRQTRLRLIEKELARSLSRSRSRTRSPKKRRNPSMKCGVSDGTRETEPSLSSISLPAQIEEFNSEKRTTHQQSIKKNGEAVLYVEGISDHEASMAWQARLQRRRDESFSPKSNRSDDMSLYYDDEGTKDNEHSAANSPTASIREVILRQSPITPNSRRRQSLSPMKAESPSRARKYSPEQHHSSPSSEASTTTSQRSQLKQSKSARENQSGATSPPSQRTRKQRKKSNGRAEALNEMPRLDHPPTAEYRSDSFESYPNPPLSHQASLSPQRFKRVLSGKMYEL